MCDPAPSVEAVTRRRVDVSIRRKCQTRQEYEQVLLQALARASTDGIGVSTLRGYLPKDCPLVTASPAALACYLRNLLADGKVQVKGHARGARWSLASVVAVQSPLTSSVAVAQGDFLATVPSKWRQLRPQKQRPDCPEQWSVLAEHIWELYPHRRFEEFESLMLAYAPYLHFDIATLGGSFREGRIREAYLALQKKYGARIDATPLPEVVLERIRPRNVAPSRSAPPVRTRVPAVSVVSQASEDDAVDAGGGSPKQRRSGGRPPGSPRATTPKKPKVFSGDRACPYKKPDGTLCGAKLRPTNPGPYCSPHQEQVDWDALVKRAKR